MSDIKLTDEQLVDIYDLVFSSVHSDGFKKSEIKDLLFDNTYWYMESPRENWKDGVMYYLDSIQFDRSKLNINPLL